MATSPPASLQLDARGDRERNRSTRHGHDLSRSASPRGNIYTIDPSTATATFVGNPGDRPLSSSIGPGLFRRQPLRAGLRRWHLNTAALSDRPVDHRRHDRRSRQYPAQPDAMTAPLTSWWRRQRETQRDLLVLAQPGRERLDRDRKPERQEGRVLALDDNGNLLASATPAPPTIRPGLNNFVAPQRRHLLRPVTGDRRAQVQPGRHPRGRLRHREPPRPWPPPRTSPRPSSRAIPSRAERWATCRTPAAQLWARRSKASTSTARTAAACRRTPTRRSATALSPRRSTSSSASGTRAGNVAARRAPDTLFGQSTGRRPLCRVRRRRRPLVRHGDRRHDNSKESACHLQRRESARRILARLRCSPGRVGRSGRLRQVRLQRRRHRHRGNDFGDGHSVVTAVDKAQAIAGTLVYYQSTPSFNFRALTPAQMHDAAPGDPMWFMASTGDPTYDGTTPNTIRVTKMDEHPLEFADLHRLRGQRQHLRAQQRYRRPAGRHQARWRPTTCRPRRSITWAARW